MEEKFTCQQPCSESYGSAMKQHIHRRFGKAISGFKGILVELCNWTPEEQAPLSKNGLYSSKYVLMISQAGRYDLRKESVSGPQPPGGVGCCGLWTSASAPQNFMEVRCPGCFKNLFRSDQSVGLEKSLTMPPTLGWWGGLHRSC